MKEWDPFIGYRAQLGDCIGIPCVASAILINEIRQFVNE